MALGACSDFSSHYSGSSDSSSAVETPIRAVAHRKGNLFNESENNIARRVFLASSAVFSILSLIPGIRMISSLAVRSVALISSTLNNINFFSTKNWLRSLINILKLAPMILGITAIVIGSKALFVGAMVGDIALRIFDAIKAAFEKDYTKLFQTLTILVITSLATAAFVTGSWPLVFVASIISVIYSGYMIGQALSRGFRGEDSMAFVEALCYGVMGATSIASAAMTLKVPYTKVHSVTYRYQNNNNANVAIFRKEYYKEVIIPERVERIETVRVEVNYSDPYDPIEYEIIEYQDRIIPAVYHEGYRNEIVDVLRPGDEYHCQYGNYQDLYVGYHYPDGQVSSSIMLEPFAVDATKEVYQPVQPPEYPFMPIGQGTNIELDYRVARAEA